MKRSSVSLTCARWTTAPVLPTDPLEAGVTDRQERVPGFDQKALARMHFGAIGAGGIGGEVLTGLIRKGPESITVVEPDTVSPSDLSRQHFLAEDLYRSKALCLGRHLFQEATCRTEIVTYPCAAQEAIAKGYLANSTVLGCFVDNDATRDDVALYAVKKRCPCIFVGVSADANYGYVFIQEPDSACFNCLNPRKGARKSPCPGVPAVIDILKVLAGITLYALDSLVMARKRAWNYRQIHLSGFAPDVSAVIERRADCESCRAASKG